MKKKPKIKPVLVALPSADELIDRARLLDGAGEAAAACEAYMAALRIDDTRVDAWVNLGALCAEADDNDEARKCFLRAVELDPEHVEARCNLAELELQDGDPISAMGWLREALEIDPEAYCVHYSLARSHLMLGQDLPALGHLRAFNSLVPAECDGKLRAQRDSALRETDGLRKRIVMAR